MAPELAPAAPAGSSAASLVQIFTSPATVFDRLRTHPQWVVPFLAYCLVAFLVGTALIQMIGMENIVRTQIESNPRAVEQLGQDRVDQVVRESTSGPRMVFNYAMSLVVPAIAVLILSGVYLAMLTIADARPGFARVLAATSYGFYAFTLVTGLLALLIVALSSDRSGMNPQTVLMFNPAAFLDKSTTNPSLYSLAGSLDLFSFGLMAMLAYGYSRLAPSLSFSKALVLVAIPWAVYVLGKAGLAALF